jgi:hypothetical protein
VKRPRRAAPGDQRRQWAAAAPQPRRLGRSSGKHQVQPPAVGCGRRHRLAETAAGSDRTGTSSHCDRAPASRLYVNGVLAAADRTPRPGQRQPAPRPGSARPDVGRHQLLVRPASSTGSPSGQRRLHQSEVTGMYGLHVRRSPPRRVRPDQQTAPGAHGGPNRSRIGVRVDPRLTADVPCRQGHRRQTQAGGTSRASQTAAATSRRTPSGLRKATSPPRPQRHCRQLAGRDERPGARRRPSQTLG